MNRLARMALVLLLVLAIGILAALIIADGQDAPWVPWLSRPNQTVNLDGPATSASRPTRIETEQEAKVRALAAVMADRLGQTGFGGGRIEEAAFDDDRQNAYNEYACTRATFTEIAHWLVTVPIIVKTTYIDYRTSFLVKVAVTDGKILQLTPAIGYRRIY